MKKAGTLRGFVQRSSSRGVAAFVGKGRRLSLSPTIRLRGSQPADLPRYLEGADEEAFGSTRVVRRPVEPFGDPRARLDRRAGARRSEEPGSSDPFRRKRSSYHSEPEARRIRSHPFDTRSALSAAKAARATVSSSRGFRSCQGNRQVRRAGEKASAPRPLDRGGRTALSRSPARGRSNRVAAAATREQLQWGPVSERRRSLGQRGLVEADHSRVSDSPTQLNI